MVSYITLIIPRETQKFNQNASKPPNIAQIPPISEIANVIIGPQVKFLLCKNTFITSNIKPIKVLRKRPQFIKT
jgi:hypothetical protein